MTHTIKKRFALGLLCALSITIASPVEATTIKETARKKLSEAYEKFEKQWKKIKPCITKGKCSKKQIATFVGATIIILGLVYGGVIYRKRQREATIQKEVILAQEIEREIPQAKKSALFWYQRHKQPKKLIIPENDLETLFDDLHLLKLDRIKQLVADLLSLALDKNEKQVKKEYTLYEAVQKGRGLHPYNDPSRVLKERLIHMSQNQTIIEFFDTLGFIPATNKDEINALLQMYGVDPLPSK